MKFRSASGLNMAPNVPL